MRAAVNAGCAASRGEIVCLLDADDIFLPPKVARVAEAFRREPSACLVYHQLQTVAADGATPTGNPIPRGVWKGDIRARVERAGGWWPRPTTSGLSFSRSFLDRVLPMPTQADDAWPDTYLTGAAPFVGPVVGLAEPLGHLRLHGKNSWSLGSITEHAEREHLFSVRRDQYVKEFHTLQETLRDRLEIEPRFSLEDHLRYQQYRRGAGEPVPLRRVIAIALRCPTLPWSMRWREAVKIALGRW
jgi:hypothetical protein